MDALPAKPSEPSASTQSPATPPLSKAALAGLVLSLIGLVFFPLSPFGFVFGWVGIAKTRGGVRRGRGVAILALVLAPFTVVTGAIQLRELRNGVEQFRTQTTTLEARLNVKLLLRAVQAAQEKSGQLPAALPLTPSRVPCGESPQPWPADAPAGWSALGFAPAEPVRFSYEYAPGPDGKSFTVRARGDLNCDGRTSLFEGRPGELSLHIENEFD